MAAKKPPRDDDAPNSELALAGEQEKAVDLRYMPPVLCQVGLPRRAVKEREFMRQSGEAWLIVQAGSLDLGKGPVEQPVPSGVMPRLILAFVTTQAVRNRTPEIMLGDSASDFLRELGHDSGGGRYSVLDKQMHALAACRMQMGFRGRTFNNQMVEQFDMWQPHAAGQRALWQGKLVLSEGYYQSLLERVVPLDNHALMTLRGTALGLDIYFWLAQRLHRLERPLDLTWRALHEQFGQEYKDVKDFRREFMVIVAKVQQAYPTAKVEIVHGGMRFYPSAPPVPYKLA